eukprot:4504238-Prymnesium_polylepis.3
MPGSWGSTMHGFSNIGRGGPQTLGTMLHILRSTGVQAMPPLAIDWAHGNASGGAIGALQSHRSLDTGMLAVVVGVRSYYLTERGPGQ